MSPKMSSLAVDDMEQPYSSSDLGGSFEPNLHVITPRHARHSHAFSSDQIDQEEVITIGGKFSVSF